MARIFLLEDDPEIREAVAEYLRLADHEVTECERGDEAARLISSTVPDLLILDVAVPGRSGFVVAKDARATGDVPIIFLTSRDDETSRITGLELGADDYVTKPFSPRELVLRVNAVLRRTTSAAGQPPSRPARYVLRGTSVPAGTSVPTLEFHPENHVVAIDGAPVATTATEWRILELLISRAPAVVTRDSIIAEALGYDAAVETRSADAHVKNLRARLGDGRWIETVRGFGYRFAGTEVP
jgi:DNA-binding response OmpR family regulator